jgi:hypothetical protein
MNERDHLEDLDVDGRVSLKRQYINRILGLLHLYASGYDTIVGCCEYGNEFPISIKR